MKVTSKGQVTIPQELRRKVGIMPGSEVEFREYRGQLVLEKVKGRGRGEELVRRLRGQAGPGMTTDEIMALTRGED